MKVGFSKLFGALGIALLSAGSAQALTTVDMTGTAGAANTPVFDAPGTAVDVSFSWTATQASSWVRFVATNAFDLVMTGYTGATVGGEYTGFVLREVGGANLTSDTGFCGGGIVPAEIRGRCNLASNMTTPAYPISSPGDTVLSSVAAGTYYLGAIEGNGSTPPSGTLSFQIAEEMSAVPLPAGGLLLLGALGGLGMMRRRKGA